MISDKNKDLVSVVMAVYKPENKWFSQQLSSLKNQTYKNLEFIFCDDCPDFPVDENFIRENISPYEFKLVRNEKNLGSNLTFEKLTSLANGKYISYCDQDDVWDLNKIETMLKVMQSDEKISLSYCDIRVVDSENNKIADSICDIRKRIVYQSGKNLTRELVISNFVTGCAMMMKTDIAKKAIPFDTTVVHDQWLAIFASMHGEIKLINDCMLSYRQHGNNQTGIMVGVKTKDDYLEMRIRQFLEKTRSLRKRVASCKEAKELLDEYETWLLARERFFIKPNRDDKKILKKYRCYGKDVALFESIVPFIPKFMFPLFIRTITKLASSGKI